MRLSRPAWCLLALVAGAALGVLVVASCTYRVYTEDYVWDSTAGPAGPGHRRSFEVFLGLPLYEHPPPGATDPAAAVWVFGLNAAAVVFGGAAGFVLAHRLTRPRPAQGAGPAEPGAAADRAGTG